MIFFSKNTDAQSSAYFTIFVPKKTLKEIKRMCVFSSMFVYLYPNLFQKGFEVEKKLCMNTYFILILSPSYPNSVWGTHALFLSTYILFISFVFEA